MRKIVLVDIDGTISIVGDRLKYILQKPEDWDSFYNSCFEDKPIQEIIDLVRVLENNYQIVYCTARSEKVRTLTKNWIEKYVYENKKELSNDYLLMREVDDVRNDEDVKPYVLSKSKWKLEDIAFILEDRNSVVKKWRDLGVKCLQVAEGNF